MKKKRVIIVLSVVVAVIVIGLCAFLLFGGFNIGGKTFSEINIDNGLSVSGLSLYSGEYVEDGSDENVEGIASVVLSNNGDTDYEYVEFTVKTKYGEYLFKASTVFAGSSVKVLCSDRKSLKDGDKMKSAELTLCTEYLTPPSLHEDLFEYYPRAKTINIKNVSGKTFSKVILYYKDTDENGYFGGITYRIVFNNVANGDIKQRVSEHFGEVVNLVYEE